MVVRGRDIRSGILALVLMTMLSADCWAANPEVADSAVGWNMLGPMPDPDKPRATQSTADHSRFESLNKKFRKARNVIKVCLECHNTAANQIHKTKHWTLEHDHPTTGQKLGARRLVNNFFISMSSNESSCSYCHIGTGWKGHRFDFSREENTDCLVCHDTTGSYAFGKFHKARGNCHVCHEEIPETPGDRKRKTDLTKVALNVGPTSRRTCGSCHFLGDGGENVKHGDLDPSLTQPDRALDVHMGVDGLDFTCSTCHSTDQHAVRGSRYEPVESDVYGETVPGREPWKRGTCRSCHGTRPMKNEKLNDHTDKVACQTCHIPRIARGGYATKVWWDWSTSGRLSEDGKPVLEKDEDGREIYSTHKGDGRWVKNAVPDYMWFNGTARYTLLDDVIDPGKVVPINRFEGGPGDRDSRIWPVKRSRGKQPYDPESNKLVAVNLFAVNRHARDPDAYWKNLDWEKAVTKGMRVAGREFSGKVGFVETEMLWSINHMVAPKEVALECTECHAENGRLTGVEGVYLPGRDSNRWLERVGVIMILLALIGVLLHGVGRFVSNRKGG